MNSEHPFFLLKITGNISWIDMFVSDFVTLEHIYCRMVLMDIYISLAVRGKQLIYRKNLIAVRKHDENVQKSHRIRTTSKKTKHCRFEWLQNGPV